MSNETGGVERRGVQRREDVLGEQRAHDLADGISGDHPRDAEAAGEHGGDRRLAHTGGAAEEDDEGDIQAVDRLPLGERLGVTVAHLVTQHGEGEVGQLRL